ncbi:52 kDa repressor of the inhibitor of the protein kinase [Folsomia candida]|uniref:52 kDa repressor of the inhibitor of the protein kinase n=1 Tax=Folsomia candida TaxID=158441 RepID=A0A226DXC1_FOLCA|nr:52 kDa repressor of the inhibitor of the protein kinase [Folsomia candida]
MFDSTPDTSHKEQISQIIRSVSFNEDGCKIEEDFIDFINFDGKTGILLAEMILNKLKSDNLEIQNCRGQGYDNGANMSGKYRGVQARIHEINPLASFIPCAAHSLNLVGQHAASSFLAGKLILGQIQNLFTFFSASTSRWATLKKHVKKSLKGQSTTRWAARAIAVSTLLDEFKGVIIALEELINSDESNIQTVADASSNLTQICTFKFILGLNIWASILSRINEANIAIQSETTSLDQATKHIAGVVAYLEEFKLTGFESSVSKSEIIAEENGINQDSGFDYRKNRGNKPARFRIEENLDITGFENEIKHLKSAIEPFLDPKDKKLGSTTPLEILNILTCNGLQPLFINCRTALRIFLTLPVTVASNERSFSKLKIIKNYSRSSMGQTRLSNLAILSIEKEYTEKISFEQVIHDFAVTKCRKVNINP